MIRRVVIWLIILILIALLVIFVRVVPSDGTARAQLPGRDQGSEHGAIACVVITWADGYKEARPSGCDEEPTATPWPTFTTTDTPGWTLTPPPTNTPRPTATDAPDVTPTKTPWPTFTVTPTDDFIPPTTESTVLPTSTPAATAQPKTCQLRAATSIRIRSGPGTGYSITGLWSQGETRVFGAFVSDPDGYVWGQHINGWSAVFYWPSLEWLIAGTTEADLCRDVAGWPWNLMPPDPIARSILGYHLLVSVSNAVLNFLDGVSVMKGLTGSYDTALMARQINPDITVICRSLHTQRGMIDGPMAWQWTAPETYFKELIGYLPSTCDYVEYINEWDSAPSWSIRADFEIAMLRMFGERGQCALFGSFGPGNPPLEAWDDLVRVMHWIDDHPCAPGRYHGLAWHMPGHMPPDVPLPAGSYINNYWIAERDQLIERHLNTLGYSLLDFRGPIYVTEFGWEDYTIPNQGFTCDQVKRGWQVSKKYFEENSPWITGVTVWNFWSNGAPNSVDDGKWVDLTPCLPL